MSHFSRTRLQRLHNVMRGHVERGEIPGFVGLIARHGEVHVETAGVRSLDQPSPMRRDSIFRIASMTKPVVAVATLMLIEEGRLHLDDSIEPHLPELANRRVLRRLEGPLDDTVPANRAITIRDLLTFTLGIGALPVPPDTYPIQTEMAELQIGGDGPPRPASAPKTDEWLRRLGSLPLMYQPGERWLYNTGSDILGVLLQRLTGQTLDDFFRERIFAPLGMNDTGFTIPPHKLDRFVAAYSYKPERAAFELIDGIENNAWSDPAAFQSGAGGLLSTVDDFLAFSQMLLNSGRHGNDRLLSRFAVETMTTNQLTSAQRAASSFVDGFFESNGWGFGVSIAERREDIATVPGMFGWTGGLGTSWTADPRENMTVIYLSQRAFDSPIPPRSLVDFRTLAYAAIDD